MIIDKHFVDLLERRGLNRKRIGAKFRLAHEAAEYGYRGDQFTIDEVEHSFSNILGTTFLDIDDKNHFSEPHMVPRYVFPVSNGINLHQYDRGFLRDGVGNLKSDWFIVVFMDQDIPQAQQVALKGKPLKDLIVHPDLPMDRTILEFDTFAYSQFIKPTNVVVLSDDPVEISVDLPAKSADVHAEILRLKFERKKDCIKHNAYAGLSLTFCAASLAAAIILAAGLYLFFQQDLGYLVLATALFLATACASFAAICWYTEDPYLEKRITEGRKKEIRDRNIASGRL